MDGAGGAVNRLPSPKRRAEKNKSMPSADMATTGQTAVQASKKAREQQSQLSETSDDEVIQTDSIKKVGAKTFYLENGVWIDSEFDEDSKRRETKLVFASDEFFDLINNEKELAQYFALGEQVVVVWKDKVYRTVK
jgi:hypothetical protein